MAQPKQKSSKPGDAARMHEATQRLEALLRNPGPGITVTAVDTPHERGGDAEPATPRDEGEKIILPSAAKTEPARTPTGRTPPSRSSRVADNATAKQPATNNTAPTHAKQPNNDGVIDKAQKAFTEAVTPKDNAPPSIPNAPPSQNQPQTGDKPSGRPGELSELRQAVNFSRKAFISTGLFSLVINVLMLAGPLFMLQVYDRVMTSGSIPTLIALSVMTAALYVIIGLLELTRSRVVTRIGIDVDGRISDRVFQAALKQSLSTSGKPVAALRELDHVRQFLASNGPLTFFDAPWTPIYLFVIFMLHWTLGVAAVLGAAVLLSLAWAGEIRSRRPMLESGRSAAKSLELAESGQRNAEAIAAMGMLSDYRQRWQTANQEALAWQTLTADRLGSMSALTKSLRLLLQSMMLAIGAVLAINGDISAGSIVAATIIFGRALAPVEQAIGHWRNFLKARESFERLEELLDVIPPPPPVTALPAPKGHLSVSGLRVSAPDSRKLILGGITFDVEPGQMLAVIGPSASGKSTLARAVVGLWPSTAGTIKIDGARLDQWDGEALGQHIGYLPQNVDLFAGTVRDNISRFRDNAHDEDIITAAKRAHAHELILNLPNGYDTELGGHGAYLSGGQRQRVALARALFGDPAIVVLDEPNANLDRIGDEALAAAIDGMRERKQAVVLVSHRVQAIGKADLLLYIDKGLQRAFGTRDDVMKMFQPSGRQGERRQANRGAPDGKERRAPDGPDRRTAPVHTSETSST